MFWLYKHHFETYSLTVIKEKGIYDQWTHEPQTIPRKCKINVDKANHSLLFLSTACVWALNLNWPDTGILFSNSSQFSQIWQGRKPSTFEYIWKMYKLLCNDIMLAISNFELCFWQCANLCNHTVLVCQKTHLNLNWRKQKMIWCAKVLVANGSKSYKNNCYELSHLRGD